MTQPPPKPNHHVDVWVQLISHYATDARVSDRVLQAFGARRKLGIRNYGTPLQPHNGRKAVADELAEALDGLAYAWQGHLEGSTTALLRVESFWLPLVLQLVQEARSKYAHPHEARAHER